MDSQYKGPKTMESYLMKKKIKNPSNSNEKTVLRYFKFSLPDKSFIYKDDQETKEIKMIYTGKDLQLFIDTVEKEDQGICDYPYGFQLITSGKPFVLFAQTKEIYTKWVRILNFHFNKIDILNPMAFLSQNAGGTVENKTTIVKNTQVTTSNRFLVENHTQKDNYTQPNRSAQPSKSTSPVPNKANFNPGKSNFKEAYEFEDQDSMDFGKGIRKENNNFHNQTNVKVPSFGNQTSNKTSNSPLPRQENQAGQYEKSRVDRYLKNAQKSEELKSQNKPVNVQPADNYEQNRINRYLKNAEKSEQAKTGSSNLNNAEDFEKNRVNRYLKNAEKAEGLKSNQPQGNQVQSKSQINENIIRGGGLSDDDEEFVMNLHKGMQKKNQNAKSPVRALEMDMDFEDYEGKVHTKNQPYSKIGNQNQPQNVNMKPVKNESPEKNLVKENPNLRPSQNPNQKPVPTTNNNNSRPLSQPPLKQANNPNVGNSNNQANDVRNQNMGNNDGVIHFRDPHAQVKKTENIKDKWLDLNDEWETPVRGQMKDNRSVVKSVSPSPVYVNSLIQSKTGEVSQKVRTIKVDAPMFDDPNLHIKKSVVTKQIKLENLLLGPRFEEEENQKEEEMRREIELRNHKTNQKKHKIEQNKQQFALQQKSQQQPAKKKNFNEEKLDERDKIFQAKQNVEKDGQKFNIEKKIYFGGENQFTFQITVPDKMAENRYEGAEQDERVRMAKEKFEKKAQEKAVYTGPDPKAQKIISSPKKAPLRDDIPANLLLSGENNMPMNVGVNKFSQNNSRGMALTAEQRKTVFTVTSQQNQSDQLIKDEQHMHVFKTFKVDQHTFVSDDFHQPIEKAVDIKQAEIEKSKKKEEPKPEPKFIEIKKDLIKSDVKKIINPNMTVVNEPTPSNLGGGENLNLGGEMNLGGENMQIPVPRTLENLIPAAKKNDNTGKKFSVISNFNPGEESFFSNNNQNFEEENRMNISRVSRLSKLDIDEVWDNSVIGNSEHDLFNNSTEFKFK